MSNASSLYLPGSNLTNLIVLHDERVSGAQFLARMWAPATTATRLTALGLAAAFRSELRASAEPAAGKVPWRRGIGVLAVATATACILLLGSPALPVLAIGLLAVAVHARSLLLGLNLGPNLAITGSLSAFLWLRVARVAGTRPSIGR